jgi:hypothetical protein
MLRTLLEGTLMPLPKRPHREHTEGWEQVKQLCLWPEQRRYELLRPVVLYGDTPAERAAQNGANERTLRRQADQFEAEGLLSFFSSPTTTARCLRHCGN